MAFVKLDTGILRSTLWVERDLREIFITALLMAEPREIDGPLAQLEIRSLKETGFVVTPGWYGFVPAAGIGIIHQARVEQDAGLSALEKLGSPDLESRTRAHGGRRMVRVDGGFVILNYMIYRDKDHGAAERMRKLRARRKENATVPQKPVPSNAVTVHPNVTQAEDRGQRTDAVDQDQSQTLPPTPQKGVKETGLWPLIKAEVKMELNDAHLGAGKFHAQENPYDQYFRDSTLADIVNEGRCFMLDHPEPAVLAEGLHRFNGRLQKIAKRVIGIEVTFGVAT
jgi:hypothetical protein